MSLRMFHEAPDLAYFAGMLWIDCAPISVGHLSHLQDRGTSKFCFLQSGPVAQNICGVAFESLLRCRKSLAGPVLLHHAIYAMCEGVEAIVFFFLFFLFFSHSDSRAHVRALLTARVTTTQFDNIYVYLYCG